MIPKIAPSILAGDHGKLSEEAARLQQWGADWIHVDIMDGIFAPNLTFGPAAVKAINKAATIPLDCHLMLQHPENFSEKFLESGADVLTVHAEAVNAETLSKIEREVKKHSAKLGIAFKPATSLSHIDLSGHDISLVIVMTVNPGFSGQKFMSEVVPKIREASGLFGKGQIEIEVDGGVEQSNAKMISDNGATVLVAGNSVFGQSNPEFALKELKRAVGGS
jgi:ribulose-phosphate 3-epimerase